MLDSASSDRSSSAAGVFDPSPGPVGRQGGGSLTFVLTGIDSCSSVTPISVILSEVRSSATHEVEGSTRSDFVCFGRAEMNRFALIPPLRALAGAPVGMTKRAAVQKIESY